MKLPANLLFLASLATLLALTNPSPATSGESASALQPEVLPGAQLPKGSKGLGNTKLPKHQQSQRPDRNSPKYKDASGRFMQEAFNRDMTAWQSRVQRTTNQVNVKQQKLHQEESSLKGLQGKMGGAMKRDNRARQQALERERAEQRARDLASGIAKPASPTLQGTSRLMEAFQALGAEDPNADPETQSEIQRAQQQQRRARSEDEEKDEK